MALAFVMLVSLVPVTASARLKGDFDENGKITAMDARTVLRIAAQLMHFEEVFIDIADMDGNNRITANDARMILRIAAKMDSNNEAAKLDENGYVILDDAIGRSIRAYEAFMSMGQNFNDPSYVIWGRGTRFVLEGSGSATPDSILMFYITDRGCVYKGIYTGMTMAQVLDILGDDGYIEKDMANLSSYKTTVDGNSVVIDFIDNKVSSIFVKAAKSQIVYDVLAMLGRTDEQAFPADAADFSAEVTEGGYILYSLTGLNAFVFEAFDGNYVRGAVVTEKNDYNFDGIHVGDDFSEVTNYAAKHGIKTETSDLGVNDLIFKSELYTAYFGETDGSVSQIIITATGYEDRI